MNSCNLIMSVSITSYHEMVIWVLFDMYLLSGHASAVTSVGFSADGSKVVSGSRDNTVKIWNADSGEVIQTLSGEIDKDMYVSQVLYILCSIVGVW